MYIVYIAALGVGGATAVGVLVGFFVQKIASRFHDFLLSFAAGVMLFAAVFGLIEPSLSEGGLLNACIVACGVICGAIFISLMDRAIPLLRFMTRLSRHEDENASRVDRVLLFVFAIAMHNLPEGIAAGVSFGTGELRDAFSVSLGIALQNIPEGMVIISPMLAAGISRGRTLLIALSTGLIEVIGTVAGFYLMGVLSTALPFMLAFAGGTMIYVICDEMIPETHEGGFRKGASYAFIAGFALMLLFSALIG